MLKRKGLESKGFSLVEALISLAMGTVFLTTVVSAWTFSSAVWKQESIRSELRYDIEKTMEEIKETARVSDGNNILFYPSTAATYTAISFPHATANASGFYTIGTGITWDQTIVYAIYDNSGVKELRKTVFNSYTANNATRQTELDSVATTGSGPQGTTTTRLFAADSVNMVITPINPTFDAYNATTALSGNTSFGNIRLTSGNHTVRFQVTGKNGASSGYRLGFDQISLTPSGGGQEAEALTVSATSGKATVKEDMSSYANNGPWNGNYQKEYQSGVTGDYIEFQTNYDQWLESNFENMTHNFTEVAGTDPALSVASRETQSLQPGWQADLQAAVSGSDNPANVNNLTIRNVISSASITKSGQMIRFKFTASSAGSLTITAAYFGPRTAGSYNFSAAPTQLYFANGTVPEGGDDGVGAVGASGPTSITIPAGEHAWTNWITYSMSAPGASDYLTSFSVPASANEGNETYWDPGSGTNSYVENGATASASWTSSDPGYATSSALHAAAEMSVWQNTGNATSQVYDTKMAAPAYAQLSWSTNGSGTYAVALRTSDNADMSGASSWASYAVSPSTLSAASVPSRRYAQFQATLTAASPYTTYPQMDNVKITWPGQTALVELSGYFTKRPNYGIFKVLVDGQNMVKALDVSLTATKQFRGKSYDFQLTSDIKTKNTGK